MDQQRLQALLLELDRELKATRSLDAQSQELLQQVLADIPAAPAGFTARTALILLDCDIAAPPAKLAAPNHKRVVEQSASCQIIE